MAAENSLTDRICAAKNLYARQKYDDCVDAVQDVLSDAAGDKSVLADLHLLLAKCHRGRRDLKSAILSCQSSIEARPQWRDAFLYRSACFQAFHQQMMDTDGDNVDNIGRDRQVADVVITSRSELATALTNARDGDKLFLEKGRYEARSLFLCGKNVTIIGASVKDVVLEYRNDEATAAGNSEEKLETFLICASAGSTPTLIKRVTFKSVRGSGNAKIKFVGVAGGTVQLEDCLFDATDSVDADAIYTNAKIAGSLASNYPPPYVIARFCVFDSCQSFGAFSAFRSRASVTSSLFVGCDRRSSVVAMDSAKVSISHCEFATASNHHRSLIRIDPDSSTVKSDHSDLAIAGSYFHGLSNDTSDENTRVEAVDIDDRSVASIEKCYFSRTVDGLNVVNSNLTVTDNLMFDLNHGLKIRGASSKVRVVNNAFKSCRLGLYAFDKALPVIKDNTFEVGDFAGVFVESESRPTVVNNKFVGKTGGGFGVLFITDSSGLVGKNDFFDFDVSPVMVFSSCEPLVHDNTFVDVNIDDRRQEVVEKQLLDRLKPELFRDDEFFYIVDNLSAERQLQDVITSKKKNLSS